MRKGPAKSIAWVWIAPLAIFVVSPLGQASPNPVYITHAPIHIDGDLEFTTANGVIRGNGSSVSPYIIEGWNINASTGNGIEVRGTSAYFIIRRVSVHSGIFSGSVDPNASHDGIAFYFVSHGRVEDAALSLNRNGIILDGAFEVDLVSNDVTSNLYWGIGVNNSEGVTLIGNLVSGNHDGIYAKASAGLQFSHNMISKSNKGVWLYSVIAAEIIANSIYDNVYGLTLDHGQNAAIRGNTLANGSQGMVVLFTDITIEMNDLSDYFYGIFLVDSPLFALDHNRVRDSHVGITVEFSIRGEISYNLLLHDQQGISLFGNGDIAVLHNVIKEI